MAKIPNVSCMKFRGSTGSSMARGDGEWMRNWEEQCKGLGAVMACDFVICNGEPDDDAKASCEALGKALA